MNNRIYDLLKHAYKTVPYYRDLFDDKGIDINLVKNNDNFEIIPILNKSDIIKLPGIFVSSDCLIYPKSENLIVRKTSGSTGIILKIYWTKQDYIRSLLPLWLIRKKYYGIEPYMKFCSFHSTVYVDDKVEAPEICLFDSGRNLSFCKHKLNKDQMGKYYAEIVKFQPVWLMLQPSIAYILSEFISCNNMEVPQSIKYIELTGEYLTEGCRKMVHETFKTPVANLYGCEEINGIAMECPNGNMHCIGSNVVVEIMDGGRTVGYGREGEIYITGLNNTTMPFIRYSLGDRGILFPPGTCACENCNPVLKILAGRLSESFIVKEGRLVNSFIFYHAVEDINAKYDNIIIQFQVVQESSSKLLAKLVLKQQQRIDINIIKKQFMANMIKVGLDDLDWSFIFLDRLLPNTSTGKLGVFINEKNSEST